jgi:hypothetical protein
MRTGTGRFCGAVCSVGGAVKVNFSEAAVPEIKRTLAPENVLEIFFRLTLYFLVKAEKREATEGKDMLVDSIRKILEKGAMRIYSITKGREIELAAELDWGFACTRRLAELNAFTEKEVYGDITLLPDAAPQAAPGILPDYVKGLIEAGYVAEDGKTALFSLADVAEKASKLIGATPGIRDVHLKRFVKKDGTPYSEATITYAVNHANTGNNRKKTIKKLYFSYLSKKA